MADYSSMKVPELKKLLASRGQPHSGNKADLIARLQEDDEKNAAPAAAVVEESITEKVEIAVQKEDEITYSDDEQPASKSAPEAKAVGKPAKEAATQPAPAESARAAEKADDAQKPDEPTTSASFALGLEFTIAEDEMKKRADRAKRFGMETNEEDKKLADRARRFGIDEKEIPMGLDSALPERSRKRGRGRNEGDGNRPGKRQSQDRRGGDDRRNARNKGRGSNAGGAGSRKLGNVLDDPSEIAKAEKRAARFAAA